MPADPVERLCGSTGRRKGVRPSSPRLRCARGSVEREVRGMRPPSLLIAPAVRSGDDMGHILGQKRGGLRCMAYRHLAGELRWPLGGTNALEPEPQRLPMDCCDDFQGEKWIRKQSAQQRRVRKRNAIGRQRRDEDRPILCPEPLSRSRHVPLAAPLQTHSSCPYRGTVTRRAIWRFPGAQGRLRQRAAGMR